jgi:hypothetical protein
MDPGSLAGLTIAVIDALLRYGERTAELISDARGFNGVGSQKQRGCGIADTVSGFK